MMNNKMKGLLKGLRYISQIFDEEEKEMQIGYPTDVKHVAHFGCDGPSANAPSWMGDYQLTSECTDGIGLEAPTKELTQLSINSAGSPAKEPLRNSPARRPHRRRSSASDSPLASEANPGRENRRSRRHQSAGSSPSGSHSPAIESSDGSFRRVRRHSKPSAAGRAAPPLQSQPGSLNMPKN